jgi:hypothetical protein
MLFTSPPPPQTECYSLLAHHFSFPSALLLSFVSLSPRLQRAKYSQKVVCPFSNDFVYAKYADLSFIAYLVSMNPSNKARGLEYRLLLPGILLSHYQRGDVRHIILRNFILSVAKKPSPIQSVATGKKFASKDNQFQKLHTVQRNTNNLRHHLTIFPIRIQNFSVGKCK